MALQSTTALATITLQAAASEVTFSGIPNTYRDLVLVTNSFTTVSDSYGVLRLNSDSGANYSRVQMLNNNNSNQSNAFTGENGFFALEPGSNTEAGLITIQLLDYSATDKHKSIVARSNRALRVMASAGRWASNTAISSIYFAPNSGSFTAGSTFSLYGRIA